jgi:hypothetical protein
MADQREGPDRGTSDRGTANRYPGPGRAAPGGTRSGRPLVMRLVYGNKLPITAAVRSIIEAQIYTTMAGVLTDRFLLVTYNRGIPPEEVAGFGPRDIPVYLLRPEDAKLVGPFIARHGRNAVVAPNDMQAAFDAVAGGTVAAESGINLNFDIDGVRFGVSFVRVSAMPRQLPGNIGRMLAMGALHEMGHHLLDPNAHRFGGVMDPVAMNLGAPPAVFSPAAIQELRRRVARLP